MGRLVAFDVGSKRTGIAVSDPLKIIATSLDTIPTHQLATWLEGYLKKEPVDSIIVGWPTDNSGQDSENATAVKQQVNTIKRRFPSLPIHLENERYTTKMALHTIRASGIGKMARRDKGLADKVSATIILQSYMERTSA